MAKKALSIGPRLIVLSVFVGLVIGTFVVPSITGFVVSVPWSRSQPISDISGYDDSISASGSKTGISVQATPVTTYYAAFVSGNSFATWSSNVVLKAWAPENRYAILKRDVNPSLFCPGYEERFSGDFSVFADAGAVCIFTGRSSYGDSATERFSSWLLTENGYRAGPTATTVVKPGNINKIEIVAARTGGSARGAAGYVVFAKIGQPSSSSPVSTEWRWIGKCETSSQVDAMRTCSLNIGRRDSEWVVDSIVVARADDIERPSVRIFSISVRTTE